METLEILQGIVVYVLVAVVALNYGSRMGSFLRKHLTNRNKK